MFIPMLEEMTESERTVPNHSEPFRSVPNNSEDFGTVRKDFKRKESHTLTAREVTRIFEQAGVARTERSIINWCHPNKQGVARLDCYFDPNEKKYFITEESVALAIKEEQAKGSKRAPLRASEDTVEIPKGRSESSPSDDDYEIRALRQENLDLKITNRGKDYFIEQLQKERQSFAEERKEYVEQLIESNRRAGELETKLLQLTTPSHAGIETEGNRELNGHSNR